MFAALKMRNDVLLTNC